MSKNTKYLLRILIVLNVLMLSAAALVFVMHYNPMRPVPNEEAATLHSPRRIHTTVRSSAHRFRMEIDVVNVDQYQFEHQITYVFDYDFVVLDGFELSEDEVTEIIYAYFTHYKNLLSHPAYETFRYENVMLNATRDMKLFMNEIENETGVRLFFWLSAGRATPSSFADAITNERLQELWALDTEMGISLSGMHPDDWPFP